MLTSSTLNTPLAACYGKSMKDKTIKELSIELTVELTNFCNTITANNIYINQILRSCSSIGANAFEANYAQSKADFISKLKISLKECYETEYWLEILYRTNTISEEKYNYFLKKCGTIRRKLIASVNNS